MKKNNKKGFILAEVIAVSVVIMVSLVIIYTQFMYVSKSYFRTFTYNSVNNLYLVNNVKKFINNDGLSNLINGLNDNYYIDITSCPNEYFTEYAYCETLMDNLGIKQILFSNANLDDLKNNLDGLSEKMKQFINYINYKDENNYRLIVEFNDETYATLLVGDNNEIGGDVIQGESLISLLLEQYSEEATTGLVKDSTNPNLYYYTGTNDQVANNFLWYGGHQWRVLEFDESSNSLTLITQQPLTAIKPASAVWESEEAYNNSYINNWLNEYFWNSLDSSIQSNIQKTTFNVGIYTDVDEIKTEQNVGLLDQTQYERAGSADSFLDIKDIFWLDNRYSSSNTQYVNSSGNLNNVSLSNSDGVRAVIKISDITIVRGDGTLTNNYQVANKAMNTNNVQVGEYINVPYSVSDNACGNDNMCTFRVVSKDSDSIKIVLNGLLPTTSQWADNASDNITINDLIYTNVLNGFIGNIDSEYIITGLYGVGMYANGNSYTVSQSSTITANIGLPTVGEMFSGNDIDLSTSSTKTFVDVNTIENPIISNYYWTMNRYSSSSIRNANYNGVLSNPSVSVSNGIRPVIYLKSGLTFAGGDGTPQNPYILE